MIVVGIDPHKKTHTAVAVDAATAACVAELTVGSGKAGHGRLLSWARRLDGEHLFAVEDCRHVSGSLERFLLGRGERVVRVPPKLSARARRTARTRGKSDPIDARAVAEGEDAGDAACAAMMAHARRAFALACAGFVNAFNPDLIVVGGSIAEHQGDRLLDPARAEIRSGSFATPAARVRLVPPVLGPDVSLAGAQPLVSGRVDDERWRRGRAKLEPDRPSTRS